MSFTITTILKYLALEALTSIWCKVKGLLKVSLATALIGCAKPSEKSAPLTEDSDTSGPWNTYYALEPSALPTCEESIQGQLWYIASTESFSACISGGWSKVDLKGEDGQDGTNGISTTSHMYCSTPSSSLPTYGALTVAFDYSVIVFSDSSALVTCTVSDASSEFSKTQYYHPLQNGSENAGCIISYDVDTAGFGWLEFKRDNGIYKVIYNDVSSTYNQQTYTWGTQNCTTTAF